MAHESRLVPGPVPGHTASHVSKEFEAYVGSHRWYADEGCRDAFRIRQVDFDRSHASAWSCVLRLRWIRSHCPTLRRFVDCSFPISPRNLRRSVFYLGIHTTSFRRAFPRSDRSRLVSLPHRVHETSVHALFRACGDRRFSLEPHALPCVSFETRSPTSSPRSGLERNRSPRSIGTIRPFPKVDAKATPPRVSRATWHPFIGAGGVGSVPAKSRGTREGQSKRERERETGEFATVRSRKFGTHTPRRTRLCARSHPSTDQVERRTDTGSRGRRGVRRTTGGNEGFVERDREYCQTIRTGRRPKRS